MSNVVIYIINILTRTMQGLVIKINILLCYKVLSCFLKHYLYFRKAYNTTTRATASTTVKTASIEVTERKSSKMTKYSIFE